MKIFISEFFFPTDHSNHETNFYVTRRLQADWLWGVLRIVQATPRIATLGWLSLVDDPPRADGLEVNRGLIDRKGRRKPAFKVYKRG
jgi:3-deoxy-D-arabino-heptulosonate 7-phosphate (DAHP) synthase